MHGSGIPGDDMGAATVKANEDGSFHLLIGATDLGTGSDTILGQMAPRCSVSRSEAVHVYSSDTDRTPFDVGAYASSTTYVSGGAVIRAAEKVRDRLLHHASDDAGRVRRGARRARTGPDHGAVRAAASPLADVAHEAMYGEEKEQISFSAST